MTNPPLCAAMIVAGSAVWFVVSTLLIGEVSDSVIMAGSLVVAVAFISGFVGTAVPARVKAAGRREVVLAGAAGVLAWYLAPLVILSQRATDAPSGTETLFFTTAGIVLASVLVSMIFWGERTTFTQTAATVLVVLGSAVLLANWERPSSFSPFLKFPVEEAIILLACGVFALGLVGGRRSAGLLGLRTSLWIGIASAAAVALVLALPDTTAAIAAYGRTWPQLILAGVALSTLATGLVGFANGRGVVRATAWVAVTPIALTALTVVERLTGAFGPTPIVWAGAAGGSVLVILGLLVLQTAYRADALTSVRRGPASIATIVLGGVATAVSVAALFLPAFNASVVGTTEAGASFVAGWTFAGAEAAVGWLPLAASLLALATAFEAGRRVSVRAALIAAVSALAAAVVYPLVVSTPLHTWTRWIPAEIQQAYGTEYARLTLKVAPHLVRYAAVAFSAVASVFLIVILVRLQNADRAHLGSALKENA